MSYYKLVKDNLKYFTESLSKHKKEEEISITGGNSKRKYNLVDFDWDDLEEDDEDIYSKTISTSLKKDDYDKDIDKLISHKFTGDITDMIDDELDYEVEEEVKPENEIEPEIPAEVIDENQEVVQDLNVEIEDADFDSDEETEEESDLKNTYKQYFDEIDEKIELDEIDKYINSYFSGLEGGKHISNIKDELNKDYDEYSSSVTLTGGNFKPIKSHKSNLYPYNLY